MRRLLLLLFAVSTFAAAQQRTESVTVTADRGLANVTDDATSVAVLTPEKLAAAPGFTLDDALHQVAGFQLFRRTSSWTANPTTEGVSLRGLGSTAASRTLVTSDQVPLNDAFGDWVHWNEIPALAIRQVELLRGGASDLYGSNAMGGVINVTPVVPEGRLHFAADASGASESTALEDAVLTFAAKPAAALAAVSALQTGGFVPIAPAFRGAVDVPANVSSQSARLEVDWHSAFLRGNVLNEARSNGTPLQTNAARVWRYAVGDDFVGVKTTALMRLYGSREGYRQAFSSVASDRNSETLSTLQRVPSDELGLVLQAARALPHELTAAMGFDVHDVRATDSEDKTAKAMTTNSSARQREIGGFADALWQPRGWSISASVRADSFRTFDARQTASNTAAITPLPEIDELMASPRVGVVRGLPHGVALTATAFRAFRGPSLNELYRTSQVGSQTTLANNSLLAERATGFEFGGEFTRAKVGHLRATYFWTEVNRPISAVLLSTNLYQRQNLGQIRSRGVMVEAQSETWRGFDATFGYQLAVATVTAFQSSSPAQANLTGKWTPEVPRQSVTATANYAAPRVAAFHLIASYQGMAFDDALNTFVLHPYARFDMLADRALGHGLSIFAGAQNLLDRAIDAGRTPILTLAAPRVVQGGVRYSFQK